MKIVIQETKNGYIIYDEYPMDDHSNAYVAENLKSLTCVMSDIFGEEREGDAEEEKLPTTKVCNTPEENLNVEIAHVNDDEEDEEVFVIPVAAASGGEIIQGEENCISEDTMDPAPEERISEPSIVDTVSQENPGEGNIKSVSHQKEESVRAAASIEPVSKASDKQSEAPKQQPYTPENTGLSQMQLSVLQVICHLVDLNHGPVRGTDINERIFPEPSNLTTLMKPLIKKGFIKKLTEGRSVEYIPLKRPDRRKYESLPVTNEDGVSVIHCEPRNVGSRSNSEGGFKI